MITEQQKIFIRHIRFLLDYWEKHPSTKNLSERRKMEGVIFSLLVTLDGGDGTLNGYQLIPLDDNGNPKKDIAGYLHELLNSDEI